MAANIFKILGSTFKRFNADKCFSHSIIISYFCFLCAVPLIALFAFATTKLLGSSEIAFRSLNVFTKEFFDKYDPSFFSKLSGVSKNISSLGWFGLLGSLIAGSFLFSNLIYSINYIFKASCQKSFFYNRLMEYIIMLIIAVILIFSLSITAVWTALHRLIKESVFVAETLNPKVLPLIDNFLIQYLMPFMLGFLVLFVLYKFIPEVKVHTRAALVAAAAEPERVGAVVSRGGRPDLAGDALPRVRASTLLIVGGEGIGTPEICKPPTCPPEGRALN